MKIFFLLLCTLFCFCKVATQTNEASISIKEIARTSLGDTFTEKELDGLTLFASTPRYSGDNHIKFMVIETESKKIIYGPRNLNGMVSWNKKEELLIRHTPEVIKNKNSSSQFQTILNVVTRKEQKLDNLKKQNSGKI